MEVWFSAMKRVSQVKGMMLVECLIAIVMALVLLSVVTQLYFFHYREWVEIRKVKEESYQLSRLQHVFSHFISHAGYFGKIGLDYVKNKLTSDDSLVKNAVKVFSASSLLDRSLLAPLENSSVLRVRQVSESSFQLLKDARKGEMSFVVHATKPLKPRAVLWLSDIMKGEKVRLVKRRSMNTWELASPLSHSFSKKSTEVHYYFQRYLYLSRSFLCDHFGKWGHSLMLQENHSIPQAILSGIKAFHILLGVIRHHRLVFLKQASSKEVVAFKIIVSLSQETFPFIVHLVEKERL
jgi:Tfp pilus assembly protein PilE